MRVKAEIWIQAYLRLCNVNGAPAVVTRRGQRDGGSIYIKICTLDGRVKLYGPAPAGIEESGEGRVWSPCLEQEHVDEAAADNYLQRLSRFDPDIWILEVEDRDGRHFLGDALIEI